MNKIVNMKVTHFDIGFEYEFDLFGISSSLRDYKLAWMLNNDLKIDLERSKDHCIELNNGKQILVPIFNYKENSCAIKLLSNRPLSESVNSDYLVPEMKHFDYFLLIEGIFLNEEVEFVGALRQVKGIEYAANIKIETLKSKENFIF